MVGPKTISLNILLSPEEKATLKQLAAIEQCSMGRLIRCWIANSKRMLVDDIPTCASGRACAAPHALPRRPVAVDPAA